VADRYVIGVQIVLADRAHHHLARIDPNPELEIDTVLAAQFLCVAFALRLHEQGSIQGALRVIFVSNGRAEQGKDTIAQQLGDIAFITMHGFHHQHEGGINEAAGFFRIEIFDERGRVFDIGKEGGDSFTLTLSGAARLHGCLLGPDMLSKVRGSPGSAVRSPD